jgi:hypothetical protein
MELDDVNWLLESDEPWTRYRTLLDLLGRTEDAPEVQTARREMLDHPSVSALVGEAATWPGYALKRHNDAKHPLHHVSVLADFGLKLDDPGMDVVISALMSHQDPGGSFQTLMQLYKRFGGVEGEHWVWMMCDAPTVLYGLLSFGLRDDPEVKRATDHMVAHIRHNGWPCAVGEPLGAKFKGPGKREDPCPYANLISLKAVSGIPDMLESEIAQTGAEMLLWHWEHQQERKLYLFAMGTDFRKLKYPFVWYDILHVAEVLSRFPFVHQDPRFKEVLAAIYEQADDEDRYTARSMYRAWKGWSFADKKTPSPWLTFLVRRIQYRVESGSSFS